MRRVNGWLTIFWIVMIPVSIATGWSQRHLCAALSLWALVSGHWSAWQAARVEVKQELEEQRRGEQDVASDVVERIVEKTELATCRRSSAASGCVAPPHGGDPTCFVAVLAAMTLVRPRRERCGDSA